MDYHKLKLPFWDSMELMHITDSSQTYPAHYHETYCLSLIEQGIFIENGLMIPAGALLITPPGDVHQNSNYGDLTYTLTTFYVSPDVLKTATSHPHFAKKVIHDAALFGQFRDLSQALQTTGTGPEGADYQQAFTRLVARYGQTEPAGEPITGIVPVAILDSQAVIRSRYAEKLSVDELGLKLGMSRFKYIRWFRRNTGLTPYDYLLLCRVEAGKQMLADGKPAILTALDVGFYDQSHFANTFKRYVGVTPRQYQEACTIFQDLA